MVTPAIYRSIEAALNVLNTYKVENPQAVSALLEIYNKTLDTYNTTFKEETQQAKKFPLIVLEGLDGCGKSTIVKVVASKIGALNKCTPPESIKHIRSLFDNDPLLRPAYYALGNYIAALESGVALTQQPVVMDRYWHSTCAFAMAQALNDFPGEVTMPPEGDSFYHWPDDLLKPDAVFLLHVSESVRNLRLSRRTVTTDQENALKNSQQFRDNVFLAYKNMVDPAVVIIDGDPIVKKVRNNVLAKIKHLL